MPTPCPPKDKKCTNLYRNCTSNSDAKNKNFIRRTCIKVLGRPYIAERFFWYVEAYKKHRNINYWEVQKKAGGSDKTKQEQDQFSNPLNQAPPQVLPGPMGAIIPFHSVIITSDVSNCHSPVNPADNLNPTAELIRNNRSGKI